MKVRFHPAAQNEFQAAEKLDHQIFAGLGWRFVDEVRRVTDRILDLPKSGSPDSAARRVVRLRRFPFKL